MTQESTLTYYQANTEDYIGQTANIDMTSFYDWLNVIFKRRLIL